MGDYYVYGLCRDVELTSPFYIGKGHSGRIGHHEAQVRREACPNARKANAIRKRMRELGFVPKVIFASGLSESDAFIVEEWLIDFWGRLDIGTGCLTNATNGGEGISGLSHSDETRRRVSEAQKKYHQDPAYREQHRKKNLGRVHSEETRKKLSVQRKGRTRSAETQAKINAANSGQKRSEEAKARMRAAALKRFQDQEYRARHAKLNVGRIEPEEKKAYRAAKIRDAWKRRRERERLTNV